MFDETCFWATYDLLFGLGNPVVVGAAFHKNPEKDLSRVPLKKNLDSAEVILKLDPDKLSKLSVSYLVAPIDRKGDDPA